MTGADSTAMTTTPIAICRSSHAGKTLLAAATLLLALAVGTSSASDRQPVKTRIALTTLNLAGADGKISTKQKACRADRKVRLIVEPLGGGGERPGGPAAAIPVGSTHTSPNGSWQIAVPLETGRRYFAEVFSNHIGKFNCRFAQTEDQLLPPPTPAS